ncbi:MAG: hypothetical protein ACE5KH_01225 [Candidatus Geothermarchaeales archaeon]
MRVEVAGDREDFVDSREVYDRTREIFCRLFGLVNFTQSGLRVKSLESGGFLFTVNNRSFLETVASVSFVDELDGKKTSLWVVDKRRTRREIRGKGP